MLEAVQVIHDARIVHSDLKPANFVMVRDKLKVIDFGIAKPISNDTTNISRDFSVGTLSYMAPEAVRTQSGAFKHGRASDIWALGIILYQMVYMQPPFAHLEPMQRVQMLSSPDLKIEFPEGHCLDAHSSTTRAHLLSTLAGCLQRDPKRRISLPDLLAHPFLRDAVEVRREVLESTVTSMMDCVLRSLGEAPESEGDAPGEKWLSLADEVWDHASGSTQLSATADFEGLGPLSAVASRVSSLRLERDAAMAEARRQEAKNAELQEQLRQLQQGALLPTRTRSAPASAPKGHQRQEQKENVSAACNTASKSAEVKPGTRDGHALARSWMHNS
jgi:serine/threonine protein kinase